MAMERREFLGACGLLAGAAAFAAPGRPVRARHRDSTGASS
ncbi:MAG TPA: twin-arginine translocation signal domain-containing protein [Casimicrobiaceae bacterium]|nr:twin-arginine translocation signal domain-containing protein [Casimicrobiaceae bacterium]